ncbi:riboflavin kinase-like isoform X2 [Orbicella faveolata]|uniref:riboflavin kinase-like isoform X2 n=1 Tax=Orbicella faveolata TaxID=48498 RepID=UPI0009E3D12F|nr:riboflavin kinase-like isoform X2 [Orbicella faveolata]
MRSDVVTSFPPYFCRGEVVKGFGRGSKELGIPTANFPMDVVDNLPEAVSTGIYYGWASVDRGPVHKMVMSIGWNPFYNNTKKSMETHIIHTFDNDFYGAELSVVILGFIRPEKNYPSLDALIEAIHADIREAEQTLEKTENKEFASHSFFNKTESDT